MKSRILMATLVVTLMLGIQAFAVDCGVCDPCSPCDPCNPCDTSCGKSCDLFSGLKKLIASRPCAVSECGPCDSVVACNPCDLTACDPCEPICGKVSFRPFKGLFASSCGNDYNSCDVAACDPCAASSDCDPCANVCGTKPLFGKLFSRISACNPCDANPCDPCSEVSSCDPCGQIGPCDTNACDPCAVACDPCGKRFGSLFDRPRFTLKKFFDGFGCKASCVTACDPCAPVGPCDISVGCPVPCSNTVEAAK